MSSSLKQQAALQPDEPGAKSQVLAKSSDDHLKQQQQQANLCQSAQDKQEDPTKSDQKFASPPPPSSSSTSINESAANSDKTRSTDSGPDHRHQLAHSIARASAISEANSDTNNNSINLTKTISHNELGSCGVASSGKSSSTEEEKKKQLQQRKEEIETDRSGGQLLLLSVKKDESSSECRANRSLQSSCPSNNRTANVAANRAREGEGEEEEDDDEQQDGTSGVDRDDKLTAATAATTTAPTTTATMMVFDVKSHKSTQEQKAICERTTPTKTTTTIIGGEQARKQTNKTLVNQYQLKDTSGISSSACGSGSGGGGGGGGTSSSSSYNRTNWSNNNSQETITTTIDIGNLTPTSEQQTQQQSQQSQQQQQSQDKKNKTNNNINNNTSASASAPASSSSSSSSSANQLILTAPTTTTTTLINNYNDKDQFHCRRWQQKQHQHQQHQHQADFFPGRTKRLGYFQSLLLRKWPCLALTICIMSSLLFSILLSALTIYLIHDAADCGNLAKVAAAAASASPSSHHQHSAAAASLIPLESFGLDTPIYGESSAGQVEQQLASSTRQLFAIGNADATAGTSLTSVSGGANLSQVFQRLPTSVVPEHYNLFVWPHIAAPSFHFNGTVEIYVKCRASTDNITLHTNELKLIESSISVVELNTAAAPPPLTSTSTRQRRWSASGGAAPHWDDLAAKYGPIRDRDALKVSRLSHDKELQYSIIHLDSKLEAGKDYLVRMDFVGSLNDDLAGFYKIKYERQNSTEITWIAATQFQATDARRAFPCFDEPLYKATFSIKIKHWTNMTALSNMPIVDSERSQDGLWITDTFAKSHRMSTYLVAFAVTNFESRKDGNITVWTRPGLIHTAEYALRIAGKILKHYEDFFGIAYPLPKMDMIALPDFNAGAMENWGLITYRETAMLYDERTSSVNNKMRVAEVVAHELAHQWFGNLVTPKWWDDLWLNEGFATFVEYIGVDHVASNWRMLDSFVIEEVQNVFHTDSMSSSHQISIPLRNPDEINEIFDNITYGKAASIIRMLSHFLTERVFKEGLRRYLNALKYSNSEQSDLWAHLTETQRLLQANSSITTTTTTTTSSAVGKHRPEMVNVERVMNSWTLQTGFPLVTLTRSYDTTMTNSSSSSSSSSRSSIGKLEQVRYQPYKLGMVSTNQSNSNSTGTGAGAGTNSVGASESWEIPITFTWQSELNWEPETRLWMHGNQTEPVEIDRSLAPLKNDEWMLINVQQVGYYRVNYDSKNWHLLIGQLQRDHTKIPPTNRAQLLDDIFELAKSSIIDYKLAMDATKYLKSERDFLPWGSALTALHYIDDMLERTAIYGDWQDHFAKLIEPYYARYKDSDWTKPIKADLKQQQQQQARLLDSDSDDLFEEHNQHFAVMYACQANNQHCINRAKETFGNWRTSGQNNIKPALRPTIYCVAIKFGTKDDWDFLWKKYEQEQYANEKDRILRALGCSKEIWILSRYLEWTFNKTKPIRRQDGSTVFRTIARNNYGRDIAFNFLRERWPTIKEYYGKVSFSLGQLIKSVGSSMNTLVEFNQLKTFYESVKGDVGTGKRSFQLAIEEAESNVVWRARNYQNIENWLNEERSSAQAA